MNSQTKITITLCSIMLLLPVSIYAEYGIRPNHIYDNGDMISYSAEIQIENYLTEFERETSNEIVIYTVGSFTGHGITKDGIELQERDMLANYIFNNVPLDGVKGIGKTDKNNGVLVLMSLERDGSGGSMRIEVGAGLEGDITDGTAGEILDAYLVPARSEYESTGVKNFDTAFYNTVVALSNATNGTYINPNAPVSSDGIGPYIFIFIFILFILIIIIGATTTGYGGTYTSGGWSNSGGYRGGGRNFGGGGFGSGSGFGAGAGR